MANEKMPDHGLKSFRVRGDVHWVDGGNNNANVGDLRGVTTVAPDDSEDAAAAFLRKLERRHQIRADIFLNVPAAD